MVAYSFNKRFVIPIQVGLGVGKRNPFVNYTLITPKKQTIRAIGKRRHARPGETLQLYQGMRTKSCFKIGEAKCTEVHPIEIKFDDIVFWVYLPASSTKMVKITGERLEQFSREDGFGNSEEMASFWRIQHGSGIFKGLVIKWERP